MSEQHNKRLLPLEPDQACYDSSIQQLFESQVEKNPDQIAVIDGLSSWTYSDINKKSNQLAHYLQTFLIEKETVIALCIERSVELLVAIMAVLKAGAAYLPLEPSHPEERLLSLLENSQAPVLILTSDLTEKFQRYAKQLVILDEINAQLNEQGKSNPLHHPCLKQLAYLIYTSGSTGSPKGVLVEQKGVVNYCLWFAQYSQCKSQQKMDFSSSPAFDMAVTTTLAPFILGLTIAICDRETKKSPRHYLRYLKESRINIIKLTPSYLNVLLHEITTQFVSLPDLNIIILAGEALIAKDCKAWLALYPTHQLFNEYGPTEASVAVLQHKVTAENGFGRKRVPIGLPGPNMQCIILNENLTSTPKGKIGELHIGGICLARGYLNDLKLSKERFVDGIIDKKAQRLYKTGDLCRQLIDGSIEYIGRIDDQVKIRGFRIEPTEIERCLTSHPGIAIATVLIQKKPQYEKKLVAYYILKQSLEISSQEIRCFLKKYLPEYMVPSALVRLETLPLNENGKLDRSALPVPQFTTSQHYIASSTVLEKKLENIWVKELGIKPIGIKDDFFELGGHSLSVARIISKIVHIWGKEINLYEFYQRPTIESLAHLIQEKDVKQEGAMETSVKSTQKEGKNLRNLPLSDFQFMQWIAKTFEPKAKKLNICARKRLNGRLDGSILARSLEAILKKHEILSYQILRCRPVQKVQEVMLSSRIYHKDFRKLSLSEAEKHLEMSMEELIHFYPWNKKAPLIMVRWFNLEESDELQICLPHIIADDRSPDIIFADLSHFYTTHTTSSSEISSQPDIQFRQAVIKEQAYFQHHLERDVDFWKNDLQATGLFRFDSKYVVKNMELRGFSYSTYHEFPPSLLFKLKKFCAFHHISLNEGLCGALMMALSTYSGCSGDESADICMAMTKSTRENEFYDNSLGCFLKVELVKVRLEKNPELLSLARQIHESIVRAHPYQSCSNLLKLGNIGSLRQEKKTLLPFIIKRLSSLFKWYSASLNKHVLEACTRLNSFRRKNEFLINVNIHQNFDKTNKEESLFGLNNCSLSCHAFDLLQINNVFDVCFLRKEDEKIYLVLSANLHPDFRSQVAGRIIKILDSAVAEME